MKLGTLAGTRTLFIFFENGEFAVILPPQPRFQAVGLAVHAVKQACIWTSETCSLNNSVVTS